jgi:hypothetical protein
MKNIMITTGFALPFRFILSRSAGLSDRPLSIHIRATSADTAGVVPDTIGLFGRLAATGALGGSAPAPWDTRFAFVQRPAHDPRDALFQVSACRLDPGAWIVLCHLLLRLHRELPLESVDILQLGDPYPDRLAESSTADSTYPRACTPLPFVLDDLQPEGGGYSFLIALASPLMAENESLLNDWLATWVQAVQCGAYALAPDDPIGNYVEPDGEIVAYDTTIEWAVFKLRADPDAAIDALLNILCCFHVRCQPILSVEIG